MYKPFTHFLTWCVQALYPYFHTWQVQGLLHTFLLGVGTPFTHFYTWCVQALYLLSHGVKPLYLLSYLVWSSPLPTFKLGVCKPFTWHVHTLYPSFILCVRKSFTHFYTCCVQAHYPFLYLAVSKSFTHFHTWCENFLLTFILGVKTLYLLSYLTCASPTFILGECKERNPQRACMVA